MPGQVGRTSRFTHGVPRAFTITADSTVLFLRERAGDDPTTCLWAVDLAGGGERLIVDPVDLGETGNPGTGGPATGGPATNRSVTGGPGIDGLATDRDGRLAVVTVAGGVWAVELPDGTARRLPVVEPAADAQPDSAGRRVAYVHRGELRVIGVDGTGDRALATPEGPDVTYGVAEDAGLVATGGAPPYRWSPDGERLLVTRVDLSGVARWHVADPASPEEAPAAFRYAAVGEVNAEVTLWVVGADGGSRVEVSWPHDPFEYLVNAGWDGHGPHVTVQSRDQRTVRFLAVAADGGATTVAAEWRDPSPLLPVPGLPARTSSGAVVAHLDDGETRHLTVAGAPVTPAGLQLRAVHGIDGDEVLFGASEDPTSTQLWSYRPDLGLRRLTTGPAVHSGVTGHGTLVVVARDAERPGGRVTARTGPAGAETTVDIESRAERPVLAVRRTSLILGPRRLRAELYLPSWYPTAGGERLPVLVDPYGGAGVQRVTAELGWQGVVAQWFAEHGFAVLVADGRGTPGRGPGWERATHPDVFGPVLEDQVDALREAARLRPERDLERVGIRGWSFGGSLALAAILRRPEVFHVAVAGAMVTDQRLYNTRWRERTLGDPHEFPERYEATSLLAEAGRLSRPLLLMHGMADTNVHVANTMRLHGALLDAGREHELVLLPGVGHRALGDPRLTGPLLRRQLTFLRRHLTG